MTSAGGEKGGGGVSEKLTKVDIWGGGGSYKGDINHDTPKGWEKEKPNEDKLLHVLRSGPPFLGLKF